MNGLWSSSVNSIVPDNSSNISNAFNKGKDACLPPGNDPQKLAGRKPNWKCQKKKKRKKNPFPLDLQHAKT